MNIFNIQNELVLLLLRNSLKTVPFNVFLAALLALILFYNDVPMRLVGLWSFAIIILSVVRWLYSYFMMKTEYYNTHPAPVLGVFLLFVFLTGLFWGSAYVIFLPYITPFLEVIIILIAGGLCAGSIGSLSVFLLAYYAYLLPIFLPIVTYNFSIFEMERIILAIMFLLFIIMLIIHAHSNAYLLLQTSELSKEKDSLIQKLTYTNKKLEKYIQKLKTITITDPLTNLYNRRYFEKVLNHEFKRAKRNDYALNLVFIDIDNFKDVNDTFGHPLGDKLLVYLANLLKQTMRRSNDTVFRLGGDEFAAILANTTLANTLSICKTLSTEFKKAKFAKKEKLNDEHDLLQQISLSIGVVFIPSEYQKDIENAVIAVDKALYEAKKRGKDQIITTKLQ
ncbi:GGDEF domain-containing protein [Legionella israelensis]|uniref:GGDEF domain-containing protein n=1 Tax=Legionella israelensis TaxID=454 RepID=UPI00117FD279|nr:GGDEF domain-containing protein [Legionella israelensis]QDP72244.1 GGDEF domain-containing protein [Legionella israelensis]